VIELEGNKQPSTENQQLLK